MDDDLVADLPALHLGADRVDNAGRIRSGDVVGQFVNVEDGDRCAEAGPDAVIVDAGRHHENEHLVTVDLPGRYDLDLHRLLGRAVPLAADRPGIHVLRHMAERRDLAHLVEILQGRVPLR